MWWKFILQRKSKCGKIQVQKEGGDAMSKRIITISREFGSGGRTIGKMVADQLGIAFYDKELIEKIAEETGFSKKFIEEYGEHAPGTNVEEMLWGYPCRIRSG